MGMHQNGARKGDIMFIKRSEYEALLARVNEAEERYEILKDVYEDTLQDYDNLFTKYAELKEHHEEFYAKAEDYVDNVKCNVESLKEEMDIKNEYIEELETALFEENPNHALVRGMADYFDRKNEEGAMDAVCRVYDEALELPAPKVEVKKLVRPVKPIKPIAKKSVETKATNKSGAKAVMCITTGRVFTSLKEAAEFYEIKSSYSITKCCKGTQKSAGKYNGQKLEWQYA